MPWLRGRLVPDRKSDCYGEVGYHGTHGHQNCCHGLNHMENGGLNRERGQGVSHDSHNDRVKKLTVKHFCEMGEYKYSIFQYNMLCYLACTPITQNA